MKQQTTFGEYMICRHDDGKAEVYKTFSNNLKALQEVYTFLGKSFNPKAYVQRLGRDLIGDADGVTEVFGEYIVTRNEKGSYKVAKLYANTKGALREISELSGFTYDEGWNTRRFAKELIDYLSDKSNAKAAKAIVKAARDAEKAAAVENAADEKSAESEKSSGAKMSSDGTYSLDWVPDLSYEHEYDDEYVLKTKDLELTDLGLPDNHSYLIERDGEKYVAYVGYYDCDEDGNSYYERDMYINDKFVAICDNAMRDCDCRCYNTATFGDNLRFIGDGFFAPDESIEWGEGLEYIGNDSFYREGSSNITELVLPDSLRYIGDNSFTGYDYLESITIPASLEYIGTGTFSDCDKVTEVNIEGDTFRLDGATLYQGDRAIATFKGM